MLINCLKTWHSKDITHRSVVSFLDEDDVGFEKFNETAKENMK